MFKFILPRFAFIQPKYVGTYVLRLQNMYNTNNMIKLSWTLKNKPFYFNDTNLEIF